MPTETLHFENPRIAQQLFNNEPRNLQAIQDQNFERVGGIKTVTLPIGGGTWFYAVRLPRP